MPKIQKDPNYTDRYRFLCPGCDQQHSITVQQLNQHGWIWSGGVDSPTFSPSILVNKSRLNRAEHVCHSFVRDGKIQFLNDSTHQLAGTTVDLPEIPESW